MTEMFALHALCWCRKIRVDVNQTGFQVTLEGDEAAWTERLVVTINCEASRHFDLRPVGVREWMHWQRRAQKKKPSLDDGDSIIL